jgi:hypothetical protein
MLKNSFFVSFFYNRKMSSSKSIWRWEIYPYGQTFEFECLTKNLKWQSYPTPWCIQSFQGAWKQVGSQTCFKCNCFPTHKSSSYCFVYSNTFSVGQNILFYQVITWDYPYCDYMDFVTMMASLLKGSGKWV